VKESLANGKTEDATWPHRERAERVKQLTEEYEMTRDDLKRFTMIVSDKTIAVYAGTSKPYEKKMGIM
jgi:selenocysteine lyase/cysteine desulfurase